MIFIFCFIYYFSFLFVSFLFRRLVRVNDRGLRQLERARGDGRDLRARRQRHAARVRKESLCNEHDRGGGHD